MDMPSDGIMLAVEKLTVTTTGESLIKNIRALRGAFEMIAELQAEVARLKAKCGE